MASFSLAVFKEFTAVGSDVFVCDGRTAAATGAAAGGAGRGADGSAIGLACSCGITAVEAGGAASW